MRIRAGHQTRKEKVMADMSVTHERVPHEVRLPAEIAGGGSVAESVAGAGAIILSVLGLVGMFSKLFAAIATLAIGGAFLLGAGATAVELSRLLSGDTRRWVRGEIASGATVEFFVGAAGIILGILALLGRLPYALMPVATIIYGAGLLLSSGATAKLNSCLVHGNGEHERAERIAGDVLYGAAGADVLIGLGGIVLGILGLAGFVPLTLSLVAMIAFGAGILMSGGAVAGRLFAVLAR
jgi:hypothetical protein